MVSIHENILTQICTNKWMSALGECVEFIDIVTTF